MKYIVEIDGRTYEVELDDGAVRVDGRAAEVDLRSSGGSGLRHLVLDGRSHTVKARRVGGGAWEVEVGGRAHRVSALDERRRAIRSVAGAGAAARGPLEVAAPMPGLIVGVEVEEGDEVERGAGLVVIEAMKMENEIRADADGRVASVRVAAGQAVEKGETLLVIEPAAADGAAGD